jgi:hypothetical protein
MDFVSVCPSSYFISNIGDLVLSLNATVVGPVQVLISVSQVSQTYYGNGKGTVLPRTGHEGPEGEWRYSSTLSLTLVLDEGGCSTPRPSRFTPGKETRYPLYRRLGGPQGRSGRLRNILW